MNPKDYIHIYDTEASSYKTIVYKEAPITSVNQIDDFFDYLEELSANQNFHIIIDLSDTNLPSAEVRSTLKNRFEKLNNKIMSYHVYIGPNFLLKIAVRYVGASLGLRDFKVHNSIENALDYINRSI